MIFFIFIFSIAGYVRSDNNYLSAGHSKAGPIVTERSQLDLLLHRLVDDLGDLNLGHLRLSHGHGGGVSGGIVSVGVASVAQGQTGVSEDRSRSSSLLGGLVSGPLTSGLTLSKTGNGKPEDVGAAGLLHSVGVVLDRNLHLLDDGLDDMWGVGEGAAQGIGVAKILSRAHSNQDRTHQQGLHLFSL